MIVLIDSRQLVAECVARSLSSMNVGDVITFTSPSAWLAVAARHPRAGLIVLSIGSRRAGDLQVQQDLATLCNGTGRLPVAVLSDLDGGGQIRDVLNKGARGFLPSNLALDVTVQALHFIRAGGTFAPASSLLAGEGANERGAGSEVRSAYESLFTNRQAAVVSALRQGKANKIIAYELGMRESTVKVHVRNIMKKLKARNRTEVAFMTNKYFQDGSEPTMRI